MLEPIKQTLRSTFPWTMDLRQKLSAKKWPKKSIVYYLGKRLITLASDVKTKASSGSDLAVFFLSREWVKLGYQVTIYAACGDRVGTHDGVRYVEYTQFNGYDQFDTLIIWRHPKMLFPYTQARRIFYDWHDIIYNPNYFTPEILNRFDKIFVKSNYQRSLLPQYPDDKFVIINNGMNPDVIPFTLPPKQPYKLIYASRYYRGLEQMLLYGWPLIKQEVPEAELHVYYGWTRRDEKSDVLPWKNKMIKLIDQPGVFEHGGVSQEKLIYEKSTAMIHYYGCTYEEIDCISLRESVLVGCVPVTTDYAVFQEKSYCVKVPGNPLEPETQEKIARTIVELLRNPQELERFREQFKPLVLDQTWRNVAKKWTPYFDS